MQILITHGAMARTRVLHLNRWQLFAAAMGGAVLLMLLTAALYHFVIVKAAREGWPVVSAVVRLVVRDEIAQRERFMRENLDAMARRLGEMQAKLINLEAVGERVSGLAGVKPEELKPLQRAADSRPQGGMYVPLEHPTAEQLDAAIGAVEEMADRGTDMFTLIESRLFESRLQRLLIPSIAPVATGVGSGFGFRADPFTGRTALHTGLDFPADTGTPIKAAAGGVVRLAEFHAQYGNMIEVDHGNGLVTRYAHASKLRARPGDLVKRGQVIADVGSTGRSTGPHLHFEVLVDGVAQNPARFLASPEATAQRFGKH